MVVICRFCYPAKITLEGYDTPPEICSTENQTPTEICLWGYQTPWKFIWRGLRPRRTSVCKSHENFAGYDNLQKFVQRGMIPHRNCFRWVSDPVEISLERYDKPLDC